MIAAAAAAAAAKSEMAGLENFHPSYLEDTLLAIVFNFLPASPYAPGELHLERITTPVNQIACCNRCCNIAWRRMFGRYLRSEMRHVIQLIERRNQRPEASLIIREHLMLLQIQDALGGQLQPEGEEEEQQPEGEEEEDLWLNGVDLSDIARIPGIILRDPTDINDPWYDPDLDPTLSP